ncbi:MAG: hypothetical protein A2287_09345 [Candidatus Melainabacteria bacterium RIFOXYA12_FULL_32_12]|nr:MAG: hypothetical protein A2255_07555 [Candidatus Melainabacteria bacterium RIFOXYA2_FULL_32_9]OGI31205.1 MAG: hypothetical protein A2287_09345 [Candidatus Melainabacteria bacterium RIFOXYA12_FULL_32_12]
MPQFFISSENIVNNNILITSKNDINHIVNVLRLKKGDKLILTDPGSLIYETEISEIKPNSIETIILDKYEPTRKLNIDITLAQSILKSQKQDIVIQKATELGVNTIIPFISQNTVVKLESEKDKNQKIQRWQKIAYESSKQCQRVTIPEISQIISINELIELNNFDVKLVCAEKDAQFSIKKLLLQNKENIIKNSRILVIIGPEGGWDDKELQLFRSKNITLVSLGNLILRAETASITAISDIIYEYEL